MPDLMTEEEIHEFGVEVVADYLKNQDYKILQVDHSFDLCNNPNGGPQIVSECDGKTIYVIVRTDVFPQKGEVPCRSNLAPSWWDSEQYAGQDICFASVGIANADASNDEERGVLFRGAGCHVAFDGLKKFEPGYRSYQTRDHIDQVTKIFDSNFDSFSSGRPKQSAGCLILLVGTIVTVLPCGAIAFFHLV